MNIIIADNDSTFMKEEILDEIASFAGKDILKKIEEITNTQMNGFEGTEKKRSFQESLEMRVEILCSAEKKITHADLKTVAAEKMHFSEGVNDFLQGIIEDEGSLQNQFFIFSGGFFELISAKIEELDIPQKEKEILQSQTFANRFLYNSQKEIIGVDWGKSEMYKENAKCIKTEELLELGIISSEKTIIGIGDGANDIGMVPETHGFCVAFVGSVWRENTVEKAGGRTVKDFFEVLELARK